MNGLVRLALAICLFSSCLGVGVGWQDARRAVAAGQKPVNGGVYPPGVVLQGVCRLGNIADGVQAAKGIQTSIYQWTGSGWLYEATEQVLEDCYFTTGPGRSATPLHASRGRHDHTGSV